MNAGGVRRLALHAVHEAFGATFALYGGWRLPEAYGEREEEYARLRSGAAAFDRSDGTRLLVSGTDAAETLGAVFGEDAAGLEEGRATRAAALDGAGRIADVALIARTGGVAYIVMGEPGRGETTRALLEGAAGEGYDVAIQDRTASTCLVAIAGPGAAEAAARHVQEGLPARLPPMHAAPFEFHGYRALAARAGGFGEDGFALMTAPPVAEHLLGLLAGAGTGLAGMAAQESARIETGIAAFTPDLETGLTPDEAGLGSPSSAAAGEGGRVLSALLFEGRTVPPVGAPALADGDAVGEMRSGARSFALDAAVGLAILRRDRSRPGAIISVGGERAVVAQTPLYRRRKT